MKEPLIFTIDFGTQSVRVALFNKRGEIVDIEKATYSPAYHSPKPGYAEQDPDYYVDTLMVISKKLMDRNQDKKDQILGAVLTTFRDSPVVLDKDNKPLRPCILWLDERRAEAKEPLPLLSKVAFRLVGMKDTIDLNRKRSMSHWIKENEPEVWAKVDKYMNISTYITMKLVGEYVDSTATQAGHIPVDFKNRRWYKDGALKGQIYGIPNKMLCKLVEEGDIVGTITEEASKKSGLPVGLKLFAGGSDKSAETLGLGCLKKNMAAVSYGTASTIEVTDTKYTDAEPFLPSYPSILNGYYNKEVQVYRGYWMLNWFEKEFAQSETLEADIQHKLGLEILNEKMLQIAPGSDGLVLQPYWGPGLRRPLAKGAIIGWSDSHTKIHLYRAIIEGIAYALREGLELFEKKRTHTKVEKIRIAGGGSKSDAICQITADVFGVPVTRIQTEECSSLGCAIAGFLAAGEFKTPEEAVKAMVHEKDVFKPNAENHKTYDFLYEKAYMKMYPQLKNIYKDIKKFRDEQIKR